MRAVYMTSTHAYNFSGRVLSIPMISVGGLSVCADGPCVQMSIRQMWTVGRCEDAVLLQMQNAKR